MKKTLLFLTAFLMVQLASAQLYINEIMVSPPGTDNPREFIELRGTPNAVIPNGTYLVSIEGDGESDPGDVESPSGGGVIDLSGVTLGANGYLVLLTTGHPYTVNPDATILLDVTDGTLEDQTHTFLLIQSPTAPTTNTDIDEDGMEDGIPDGTEYTSWTVLDGIAFADDDSAPGQEYAYADVVFAEAAIIPTLNTPATATVVSTPIQFDYAARIGNSTGSAVTNDETTSDWVGGDLPSVADLTVENWAISSTTDRAYPNSFAGSELNHIGGPNPSQNTLSIEKVTNLENLRVYPNPAASSITIDVANNRTIDSVELYNVLGMKVLSASKLEENTLNISTLISGMYIVKINVGTTSVTRRVLVE